MKNSLKVIKDLYPTNQQLRYEEISYAHMKYIKLQLSVKCKLIFLISGIFKKNPTTLNTSAASNYYIYIYWV